MITLGEGILGTIAAVAAVVAHVGWSAEAILIVIAGTGLTFGLWWTYFILPSAPVLARHRERKWAWGYGHIVLFGSVAAVGAGLHVAAYAAEGETTIGTVGVVLAVAIPVFVFTPGLLHPLVDPLPRRRRVPRRARGRHDRCSSPPASCSPSPGCPSGGASSW